MKDDLKKQLKMKQQKIVEQDEFIYNNKELAKIELPEVKRIGEQDEFIYNNKELAKIELPELKRIGENFVADIQQLTEIELPPIEEFLYDNPELSETETKHRRR